MVQQLSGCLLLIVTLLLPLQQVQGFHQSSTNVSFRQTRRRRSSRSERSSRSTSKECRGITYSRAAGSSLLHHHCVLHTRGHWLSLFTAEVPWALMSPLYSTDSLAGSLSWHLSAVRSCNEVRSNVGSAVGIMNGGVSRLGTTTDINDRHGIRRSSE